MCLVHPQAEAKIPHTTINNYNNQKKFNKPNRNPSQRPNCIKFLQMETVWKWNHVFCPAFVAGYIEIETATLFSETASPIVLPFFHRLASWLSPSHIGHPQSEKHKEMLHMIREDKIWTSHFVQIKSSHRNNKIISNADSNHLRIVTKMKSPYHGIRYADSNHHSTS